MVKSTSLGRRLGIVATAGLLSVALPAGAAWAQKVKDKGTAETTPSVVETEFSVDIPEIASVDSNVDDDTIRAIFSGALIENADALAGLTATSITIPEITLLTTTTVDGEPKEATVTFSDLVLSDVADGIAGSVALSGMAADAGDEGTGDFGAFSASNFDIGGVLGLYGLVDGSDQTELETIYTDFNFEGGSFAAEDIACTMGPMTVGELKARPLKTSFAEMVALVETLDADEDPSPAQISQIVRMYADFFTAFESSPSQFGGFDCTGEEDGKPMSFSIAGMSMGAMSPGVYPSVSMDGFDVTVEGDGTFQVGNITIKQMDLSGPIAAIENAPAELDEAWFEANARTLIPAFEGFSLSGLVFDIPDPDADGERISANIGSFDLTLSDYLNGIPTAVRNTADNIVIDLPENSDDETLQQFLAMGLTSVDTSYVIDSAWNEAEDTIVVNEISMTGADLGKIVLTGLLTNATENLFSLNENQALAAAMGIGVRSVKLDMSDDGLADMLVQIAAAEDGSDPATIRPVFAGLAEGTIVGMLAGAADAQKVGGAVSAFIAGTARNLSIELTSKEPAGLGIFDFMAAEDDPTILLGKVNIDATAK